MDVATAGTTSTVAARMLSSSVNTRTTACRAAKVQQPNRSVQENTMTADTLQETSNHGCTQMFLAAVRACKAWPDSSRLAIRTAVTSVVHAHTS
jgi:hypothetical protein